MPAIRPPMADPDARRPGPHRPRLVALALLVTIGLVSAACNPVFGETDSPVQHDTLTSDTDVDLEYIGDGTTITALPSPGVDPSVREVFWSLDTPYYPDQQACIDWYTQATSQPGEPVQPGLAMRIAPTGDDETDIKAVTVTENIWAYGVWIFNVHVWDSSKPDHEFQLVQSHDLQDVVIEWTTDEAGEPEAALKPPPWHVCARTHDDQFTFKVWIGAEPEPAWDDPTRVFSTTLPPGWDHAGYSGGYVGHLHQDQSATFSRVTTMPLCLAPGMAGTPRCQDLAQNLPGT